MYRLNAIQQLIDLINRTQQTRFYVLSAGMPPVEDSDLLLQHVYQYDAFAIWGQPSDQVHIPLLQGMLALLSHAADNDDHSDWLDFLSAKSSEMPDTPIIEIDKTYRLCQIRSYNAHAKDELLQLSAEVLAPMVLYTDNALTLLLMEATPMLNETISAFYETASLELGQTLSLYLSSQAQSPEELPEAYATLIALEKLLPAERAHAPVFFEAYLSELLFEEWLSHKPGPIFKAIRRQRIVAQFDEETLRTIDMLFQKNLNLTDTAKALFIHRNTLIYRLDKIEKLLGFDLRRFEDCFQLKLLLRIK